MVKSSTFVLGLLLASGSALAKKGKKGEKGPEGERIECGSFIRDVDGGRYTYYRDGDELYVEAATEFWTNISAGWESKDDFDPKCTKDIFFNSGFLAYNPYGHPGLDFNGGGYGNTHWDMHFMAPTTADMAPGGAVDTSSCEVTGPVPILCDLDSTDPRNVKFMKLPQAEEMTGFVVDNDWGGHAVVGHGLHLLDARAFESGNAGSITLNNNNITSPVGPPPFAVCLMQADGNDYGCRVGVWDGLDPVLISFDGEVIAHEPMFSTALVANMASQITDSSELAVRAQKSFPRQQKYKYNTKYATDVFVEVGNDDNGKQARIGIVVDDVNEKKNGKSARIFMEFASSDSLTSATTFGGIALLVVGVALIAFRATRKSSFKVVEKCEDLEYCESTPLV